MKDNVYLKSQIFFTVNVRIQQLNNYTPQV